MPNLIINDASHRFEEDQTLLDVLLKAGIYIPNLCYNPILRRLSKDCGCGCNPKPMKDTCNEAKNPSASCCSGGEESQEKRCCRLCIIELEYDGKIGDVYACCTKAIDGMIVRTETLGVNEKRRLAIENLWALCPDADILKELAERYNIEEVPFSQEDNDCIQCGMCIDSCREIVQANALGFVKKNGRRYAELIDEDACIACGFCYSICPTGAINPEKIAMVSYRNKSGSERLCRFAIMGLIPFAYCANSYNCARCEVDQRYRTYLPIHPLLIARAEKNNIISRYLIQF